MLNNTRPELEARIELVKNRIIFLDEATSKMCLEQKSYERELEALEQLYHLYKNLPEDPIDTERKEYGAQPPVAKPKTRRPKKYKPRPLSEMEKTVLHLLSELDGLTTAELASYLELTVTQASNVVYNMKKKDLVVTAPGTKPYKHYAVEGTNDNRTI